MAEWLLLRLSRTPDTPVSWLLADSHGQALAAVQSGSLREAAAQAGGRRVCALINSGDVLITEVELPLRGNVRPQQVVAYALEEQLATDIEALHFALGERAQSGTRTVVAVIARTLLAETLSQLTAVGLKPEVVCPEDTLVPINPGHSVVLLEGDSLTVRRAEGGAPLIMPADNIGDALGVAFSADIFAAENLLFYATPLEWQRRSSEVEALRGRCASLKVQLLSSGVLPLLAPQLANQQYINLLQGEYGGKTSFGFQFGRWRLAAILAGALIGLHVTGQGLALWQLHRADRELDDSIRGVMAGALPGDSGTGNVRQRAQALLQGAQAGSSAAGFNGALGALARALPEASGTQVRALNFKQGQVDLRLRASDAATLERLNQSLRANGWKAELTSGNATGGNYEGQIQMRASAAP